MNWNDALTGLREILQELYPTVERARIVLAEAGIGTGAIAFDSAALLNWHTILEEVQKHRQVPALVTRALRAYPERNDLREALSAYLATQGRPGPSPSSAPTTIPFQVPYASNPVFVGRDTE